MIEIFKNGGPLMYPILFCSVIGWAIFLERLRAFTVIRRDMPPLLAKAEHILGENRPADVILLCQQSASPLAKILLAILKQQGASRSHLKEVADEVGGREVVSLQRYLGLLGTIANIAPLLGLLGTVLGMIEAFNTIAALGVGTPATLGGGISQALITTAAGLSVAVPMILIHRYLCSRAERLALEMEEYSLRFVDQFGRSD
ncbi:MAG TPA: MotA/TolQ/ExbB proton channel family protein [Malonomonas sp.]